MYENAVRHTNIQEPTTPSSTSTTGGITATGLGKRFGDLWALRNLDLHVAPGTVLGLLGHNGAGKTTAIRILTTLSQPTEGSATVAGLDVVHQSAAVRGRIGVASQQSTVDGLMSARLNLQTIGRLRGMSKAAARQRGDELLEQLDLTDFATALVKTYSGGMRRRLDVAASLMGSPEVLFLDEPTTGLDPRSRGDLWQMLADLVREGTTIILTTQYLEEADRMADDIVVLDHGETVAHGTPEDLKARIGDDRIDVKVAASQRARRRGQRALGLRRQRPNVRQRRTHRHRSPQAGRASHRRGASTRRSRHRCRRHHPPRGNPRRGVPCPDQRPTRTNQEVSA